MTKGSHLGELEELVLLATLRLGPDAHGGGIRRALAERAHRRVSISTVYVTLLRLEEKGYARSWKGEPSAERGGKAKRHYEVTRAGLSALERSRSARASMWEGVVPDAAGGAARGGSRG
ncbi:MAG: PadR family transcriptional regulator [Gemmatimonadales bacterium]